MSDGKSVRRGKGSHNPINSRMPEEYICFVGSPSNTFNGYYYYDPARAGEADGGFVPMAHPRNLGGISRYLKGYPERSMPAETHDLYWGNFLDPAIRLYANGVAKAKPGDVITVIIYMTGYIWRGNADWDASPYNQMLHSRSPWVRGNPEYDPYATGSRVKLPPPPATGTDFPLGGSRKPDPPSQPADHDREDVLDHDILMRTTTANSDGVIKRPTSDEDYLQYIHNVPRRIVYGRELGGTAVVRDILVKVLLVNKPDDFLKYLKTGQSSAKYWKHTLDTVTEGDSSGARPDTDGSYYDATIAFSSRAWQGRWKRLLKAGVQPPSINRKKVKIRRFDYFGHSGSSEFWPLYGWYNAKGELPNFRIGEFAIDGDMLKGALGRHTVVRDSFAQLWGCNLGDEMAPKLKGTFKKVVACTGSTDFAKILDTDASMPEPSEGNKWDTFSGP